MPVGTVNRFNPEKGFGFISPEVGSADLFVHQGALEASAYATLAEGSKVTFVAEESDKGPRAADIKVV